MSCSFLVFIAGKAQKYLWRPVEQRNGTCLVPLTIGTPVSHPERSRQRRKQILNDPELREKRKKGLVKARNKLKQIKQRKIKLAEIGRNVWLNKMDESMEPGTSSNDPNIDLPSIDVPPGNELTEKRRKGLEKA
uniref:Ribosome biogenesis protein NOP53 n=1 Tax=Bursaphelenchus xylophilus TaxID=6326 RepID=A0A1I7SNW2_BURXY